MLAIKKQFMKKVSFLITTIFFLVLFYFAPTPAWASEGNIELRNTTNQDMRCFASSVLMPDFNYSLIISCRGLIYPPATDLFSYVLWSTSATDGKIGKLGELGVGKASFQTATPFSSLFVTQEPNNGVSNPSNRTVMQGSVQSITFLSEPARPPAETPALETLQPQPTATATATRSADFASRLRRAVIIFIVAIFIFVIGAFAVVITLRRMRE